MSEQKEKIIIKPLSKERYEAFIGYTRNPMILFFTQELEYWSDANERVIGLLSLDNTDEDFSITILARDERRKFRAIDIKVSIDNIEVARNKLFDKISEWAVKPDHEYYQESDDDIGVDLFKKLPDVDDERLHPSFKALRDTEGLSPAKGIIAEVMPHYIDIDKGQFVKQFQTSGFNQRVWELYLFCFLNEELFERNGEYNRPDFYVEKMNNIVGIEAVTVGQVENREKIPNIKDLEKFTEYMRIRFIRALKKKLKHQSPYWLETHMTDIPFVLAIADFHFGAQIKANLHEVNPPSSSASRVALIECLYGYRLEALKDKHGYIYQNLVKIEDENSIRQSRDFGFFNEPNSDKISAIIFSSLGSIAKFNRMGKIAGFGSKNVNITHLAEMHNPDPTADEPLLRYSKVLPGEYEEFWGDGINIYHNPYAEKPLELDLFPNAAHHYLQDGQIVTYCSNSHTFCSLTFTGVAK